MNSNSTELNLFGHGTDGSDGILEGIHLRWFFDRRLGFPLGGFCLYRRLRPGTITVIEEHTYMEGDDFSKTEWRARPAPGIPGHNLEFSSPHPFYGGNEPNFTNNRVYIHFTERLEIKFPRDITFAEVRCYIKSGNYLKVEGWYDSALVDQDTAHLALYTPITLRVDGVMNRVVIYAKEGGFSAITYGWPEEIFDDGSGWIPIACPIGLPFTHPNYPLKHKYFGQPRGDWKEARDRRGKNIPYDRHDFLEMRAVFEDMFANEPPGSMQIRYYTYPAEDDANLPAAEQSELRILPADLIYLTSLDPLIARIVGLAYIDTNVDEARVYDYMIEGIWTDGNVWLLEDYVVTFQRQPTGAPSVPYLVIDELLFHLPDHTFEDIESELAETSRAIIFPGSGQKIVTIRFPESVREVQLFISGDVGTAEATGSLGIIPSQLVTGDPNLAEQILHLSHENGFNWVALRGDNIRLNKICYDYDHLGHPESGDVIYTDIAKELQVEAANRPDHPQGLTLESRTGQTVPSTRKEGQVIDGRLQVGLRWKAGAGIDVDKYSLVRFQAERLEQGSKPFGLNGGTPIILNNVAEELEAHPAGTELPAPQFVVDLVKMLGTFQYHVRGMDIFGRISDFCPPEAIELTEALYPPPPPPANVKADYLDDADPYLLAADRTALGAASNALKVTWEWTDDLHEQAPDVGRFHIHVQSGWLNNHEVTVDLVEMENGPAPGEYPQANVIITAPSLGNIAADDLAGGTFQSAGLFYPIDRNLAVGGNGEITLWLDRPETSPQVTEKITVGEAVSQGGRAVLQNRLTTFPYQPELGPASLIVSPRSPAFVDFANSAAWEHHSLETVSKTGAIAYTAVISPPPLVPSASAAKLYAQVTVTADDGRQESVTAPPATVIAIYRVPPPPPERSLSPDTYATFPDVYGRSGFTFRFPEAAHGYEIYRSNLSTLQLVDRQERANGRSRSVNQYNDFLAAYDDNQPLYEAIVAEIIMPSMVDYAALDNDLLQALASLPGNERAFTKLHSGKLLSAEYDENGEFVYADQTLPGDGAGVYFFRARAVDEVENVSEMGPASMPVRLRDVMPPRSPAVRAVLGGEKEVVLQWWPNTETHLEAYRLYRSATADNTADIRLMGLVATIDPADNQTQLPLNSQNPPATRQGYEFRDQAVVPGSPYFYRLIAVRQLVYDDGREAEVLSRPTAVLQGQAYDVPPEPPVWDEANSGWVYIDDDNTVYEWDADLPGANDPQPAVRLVWTPAEPEHEVMIASENPETGIGTIIQNFALGQEEGPDQRVLISRQTPAETDTVYTARSRSQSGLMSTETTSMILAPPA
jgi:hypothetical protein